jgi:hypothetical protein
MPQEKRSVLVGGHSIGHSKHKIYMCLCPIPNGYRDTAISLYTYKIINEKEILRTVSDTGIYCSSGKVYVV